MTVWHEEELATLHFGDCIKVLAEMEPDSADLVVTSPPYFALRSYTDGGEHYDGQIGSEATPQAFLEALWAVTAECRRVLKPSGSMFVNLGDKYAGSGGHNNSGISDKSTLQGNGHTGGGPKIKATRRSSPDRYNQNSDGIPAKSLMMLPQRYAIGCIDQLGLILRSEIIWSKPNGLPESVTDRVRRSHEHWFHMVKEPRYFSAVDEVREEYAPGTADRYASGYKANARTDTGNQSTPSIPVGVDDLTTNPLGKLPGSVWTIGDGTDPGLSTIGAVLNAVKDGHITPEQGEAILWVGRNDYGQRSTRPPTVGGGQASSTDTDTDDIGTQNRATDEHTDSPTNSSEGQFPTGSPLTTSAEIGGASTPTTSNPSVSRRTSADDPSQTIAPTDTSTTNATPTSEPTANESAGHAWPIVCVNEDDSGSPPSVWVVPTEPLRVPDHIGVDHFAAFPSEWPRRLILGWSPSGVCVECGEGRRPVRGTECEQCGALRPNQAKACPECGDVREWKQGRVQSDEMGATDWSTAGHGTPRHPGNHQNRSVSGGEACACPDTTAPTRPAVVLDPFSGTGTTVAVAKALGRHGVGIDMSEDYLRLARWRIDNIDLAVKVAERSGMTAPAGEHDGMVVTTLFEEA